MSQKASHKATKKLLIILMIWKILKIDFSTWELDFFKNSQNVQEKHVFYDCSHQIKLAKGQGASINQILVEPILIYRGCHLYSPLAVSEIFLGWVEPRGGLSILFIFQSKQSEEGVVTFRRFQRLLPSWVAKVFVSHPSIPKIFTRVTQNGRIKKENPSSESLTVTQLSALDSWY